MASAGLVTYWKYQGRYDVNLDPNDPLYDAGAQFYSPGTSALTQLDSVMGQAGDPLSLNRSLYAESEPGESGRSDGNIALCTTCGSGPTSSPPPPPTSDNAEVHTASNWTASQKIDGAWTASHPRRPA
jgi:hypothetical protein